MLIVTTEISIPTTELELTYVRSSGPGGQNVNKVNSKAVLRWNLLISPSLTSEARAKLLQRLSSKLTRRGELIVSSDRTRDQARNREDCIEKLRMVLMAALKTDKPRKKSKPSHSSKVKARHSKSLHGRKKQMRGKVRSQD